MKPGDVYKHPHNYGFWICLGNPRHADIDNIIIWIGSYKGNCSSIQYIPIDFANIHVIAKDYIGNIYEDGFVESIEGLIRFFYG